VPEDPDDGTLLVRRPPDAPKPTAPVPEDPDDGTLLVRRPSAETAPTPEPDDSTRLTRRTANLPADITAADDPGDIAEDATRLTRRPAPASVAEPIAEDAEAEPRTAESAVAEPVADDATRLTRRPAPPEDRTRITRRPAPDRVTPAPAPGAEADADVDAAADDRTQLGARRPADAADAERTRLGLRRTGGDAPAEGTALSPRSRRSARTRAAKAKAKAGLTAESLPSAPPLPVDERPVTERYAIRTRQVDDAPVATDSAATPTVGTGDGGLAARIERRRALRTRLIVLVSTAAALTVGSFVGLVLLIAA
jgi:hypothetical protein